MNGRLPRPRWRLVLCVVGAVWLLTGCDRAGGKPADASHTQAVRGPTAAADATGSTGGAGGTNVVAVRPDSPQFKQLRIEPVHVRSVVVDEVIAPGRIMANPNRVSRLLPPVQGRVLDVLARLGDFVEQGQPLVSLDSPDADAAVSADLQAESAERQAAFALTKSETEYKRSRDLYEHQAVAEKDLLAAQNDVVQAKANAESSRAARDQARRKLELLGLRPGEFKQATLVRAPISGKVLEINVTRGEYRGAVASHSDTTTAPLMTIADLSSVWMSSDVPEPAIRLIHVGESVEITLVAFPDEVFRGRVARIGDALDSQTRTLRVYVELPNPKERLRPEMFGSIRHAGAPRSVPVVPPGAIVYEYGRSVVFVEIGPGRFERRPVTTGPRSGTGVVAVLDGLRPDERVVVDGAVLLKGQ